jgi:hypothetical protein
MTWVESADPAALAAAVGSAVSPGVLLVDSQSNGSTLAPVDVALLLQAVERAGGPMKVVVDVTLRPIARRALAASWHGAAVELVTVESATKLAQLGLDRVSAGIVVAPRSTADRLDEWREHLGTNLAAAVARQLPRPSRSLAASRWDRHERTAAVLAGHLDLHLRRRHRDRWLRVVFHGLGEAGSGGELGCGPGGGVLVGLLGPSEPALRAIVGRAISLAAAAGIPLTEGTSFGLDATRLAVITELGGGGSPVGHYLRIAAGAGPPAEAAAVATVVAGAVDAVADAAG